MGEKVAITLPLRDSIIFFNASLLSLSDLQFGSLGHVCAPSPRERGLHLQPSLLEPAQGQGSRPEREKAQETKFPEVRIAIDFHSSSSAPEMCFVYLFIFKTAVNFFRLF